MTDTRDRATVAAEVQQAADAVRDSEMVAAEADTATEEAEKRVLTSPHFVLNLPYRLAQKMKKGDWEDPLLLQFLPLKQELHDHPLFVSDPVLDSSFTKTSKLLHKYTGRALLLCTSACAMHCR